MGESPRHQRTVRAEFSRQAEAFAAAPSLRADELTAPVARAVGRVERVLDVACGPGVLVPTLMPQARRVVGLDLTVATLHLASDRPECAGQGAGIALREEGESLRLSYRWGLWVARKRG